MKDIKQKKARPHVHFESASSGLLSAILEIQKIIHEKKCKTYYKETDLILKILQRVKNANKKIVVTCCADCPYCQQLPTANFFKDIRYSCELVTNIIIEQTDDDKVHIDCPLENDEEWV